MKNVFVFLFFISLFQNNLAVASDPLATSMTTATSEERPVSLALIAYDIDPGDKLRYEIKKKPKLGDVKMLKPGGRTVTYTPRKDSSGKDHFTFIAKDRAGHRSPEAFVMIQILPVNDPPSVKPVNVKTGKNTPVEIALVGNDPDGDSLNYKIVSAPAAGKAVIIMDQLKYSTAADYSGTISFDVIANDGKTSSAPATITIHVAEK